MNTDNSNRLLDNLADKLSLTCLAEIKNDRYAVDILKELLEIDKSIFAVQEWNEAYRFFSGRHEPYSTEDEARLGLMTFLSKERWQIANQHFKIANQS